MPATPSPSSAAFAPEEGLRKKSCSVLWRTWRQASKRKEATDMYAGQAGRISTNSLSCLPTLRLENSRTLLCGPGIYHPGLNPGSPTTHNVGVCRRITPTPPPARLKDATIAPLATAMGVRWRALGSRDGAGEGGCGHGPGGVSIAPELADREGYGIRTRGVSSH